MRTNKKPLVLFASAEVNPLAKVGGLADVAGSLPAAILELGIDMRIVMPKYGTISETQWHLEKIAENIEMSWENKKIKINIWQGVHPKNNVPIYLIEQEKFISSGGIYIENDASSGGSLEEFYRFNIFAAAIPHLIKRLALSPDILHINDWHLGLAPSFAKTIKMERQFKILLTIHNLAYQGVYPADLTKKALGETFKYIEPEAIDSNNNVNSLLNAILSADWINTVSPSYKDEIMTSSYGNGLDQALKSRKSRLNGIINGIDNEEWNPQTDVYLSEKYTSENISKKAVNKADLQKINGLKMDPSAFLLGMVSRLTEQKGFDILFEGLDKILSDKHVQLIVLASGDPQYAEKLNSYSTQYPGQLAFINQFDQSLAHKIYGGADAFLMPSRFEPCGLGQMIAMRYGTVPVVHATGGLKDTVQDDETGFVIKEYKSEALITTLNKALKIFSEQSAHWLRIQTQAMAQDFSWNASARKYAQLYEKLINES